MAILLFFLRWNRRLEAYATKRSYFF